MRAMGFFRSESLPKNILGKGKSKDYAKGLIKKKYMITFSYKLIGEGGRRNSWNNRRFEMK
jgi:hypothetical protein